MTKTESPVMPLPAATGEADRSLHRSGAVARMLRMPVATLRVWERRYRLTQGARTPSGQRLYSADDVRRLALIKQLTDLGHAVGSLAPLDMLQLQRVTSMHARALAGTQSSDRADVPQAPPAHTWRLAVVGAALASRLKRPGLLRWLGRPVLVLGPFDDVSQAALALQGAQVDALLVHQPRLHDGWLASIEAAAPTFAGVPTGVLYSFAADPVCEALAAAGTALLREPQPDAAVAQWLKSLSLKSAAAPQPAAERSTGWAEPVPPRRWDDAALADFANLSPTIACECPRHVAELLIQLSHFEAYSADCEHRSAADAELHVYLGRVAAAARVRLETALEHVALHEGLLLPPSASVGDAAAVASNAPHAIAPVPATPSRPG